MTTMTIMPPITQTIVAGLWRVTTSDLPWPADLGAPHQFMTEIVRLSQYDGRPFVRMGWGAGFHEAAVAALEESGEAGVLALPGVVD